jgi:hypothetical protein
LYLYAIAEGLQRVDDLAGAGGEPLTCLVIDGVEVIAGELDATPAVDGETLVRQDRVVRRLHARAAALLPMRFGGAFASETEMRRALAWRLASLRERLALVRGAEQMTLRVLGAAGGREARDAPGAGVSGAEYLRARAARAVPPEIEPLLDALKPLARDTRVEPGKGSGVIATVYQLIDRGASAEYDAAITAVAHLVPALSVRVTGPAPCYAFT